MEHARIVASIPKPQKYQKISDIFAAAQKILSTDPEAWFFGLTGIPNPRAKCLADQRGDRRVVKTGLKIRNS